MTDALPHGFGACGLNDLARDLMNRIFKLWPKLRKPKTAMSRNHTGRHGADACRLWRHLAEHPEVPRPGGERRLRHKHDTVPTPPMAQKAFAELDGALAFGTALGTGRSGPGGRAVA